MKKLKSIALPAALAGVLAVPSMAKAASSYSEGITGSSLSLGALVGPGFFNNSQGTNASFSVEGDYKFNSVVGYGLYLSYTGLGSVTVPTIGSYSSALTLVMPQANYYFQGDLQGWHLGAKLGLGWSTTTSTVSAFNTGTSTEFAFGPAIGYDYAISPSFTVGGEASFFDVTTTPSTSVFSVLAAVKIWI
jgi:hypothetical protein